MCFSWRCEVYRTGGFGVKGIKLCWVGICKPSCSTSDFSGDGGRVLLAQGCPRPGCEVEPGNFPTLKSSGGNSVTCNSPDTSWGVQQGLGQLGWNCGQVYLCPPRHWKYGVPICLWYLLQERWRALSKILAAISQSRWRCHHLSVSKLSSGVCELSSVMPSQNACVKNDVHIFQV